MIHPTVLIGASPVGTGHGVFVIAEAGVNHNGEVRLAHRLIDEAKKAGADAVKFQSFITDELITRDAPKAEYQTKTTGPGGQYEMLKRLELTADHQRELKAHCGEAGILYLCTPYDQPSVEMLDGMNVRAFKIASTDVTNTPFLRFVASKGRPVILSTGMSTLAEVEQAVAALTAGGLHGKSILLHCISQYPAAIEDINLRAMETLRQAFSCPVGFSDHTKGIEAGPWAVAAGACMLEKHFTLDRHMDGPDHRASLEPDELSAYVRAVRQADAAMGDGIKRPTTGELSNKVLMQKSIVAVRAIRKGDVITADSLSCKRPAKGLAPTEFDEVVGRKAAKTIAAGEMLVREAIDWQGGS
jgi:N,N'-diacetyllegionaminate synthase